MPDMKLVNMKMPKRETGKSAMTEASPADVDRPVYPWGLQLTLDEDALEKLGIKELPAVDKPLMLVARVDVTGVNSNEHKSAGDKTTHKHRSVSLQITDLALGADEDEKKPAAQDVLYKG